MATAKTPAMILQEYTVKKGISPPAYELIHELTKQGTHNNEFHYRVAAANLVSRGRGSSKQIAKHEAAKRLLDMLIEQGLLNRTDCPVQNSIPGLSGTLNDCHIQETINCISKLIETCEEHKIPLPEFIEVSAVGPAHCKAFTYECNVGFGSVRTQASAGTKKQAKQKAAKDMLDRIAKILPELKEKYHVDMKAIESENEEAVKIFGKLSVTSDVKQDLNIKIEDYNLVIANILRKLNILPDEIRNILSEPSIENLQEALKVLELNYIIRTVSENSYTVIVLTFTTESPFAVMGVGKSYEEAINNAVGKACYFILRFLEPPKNSCL